MPIVEYQEIIPCSTGTPTVDLNTTEWLDSTVFRSGTDLKPMMEAHAGDPGALATDDATVMWIDQPGYQAAYIAAYGDLVPPRPPGAISMGVRGRQDSGWSEVLDRESLATFAVASVLAPVGAQLTVQLRRLDHITGLPVHTLASSVTTATGSDRIDFNFSSGGATDAVEWLDALLNADYRINVSVVKDAQASQAPYDVAFLGIRVVWTVDEPEEPPDPPDPVPVQAQEFGNASRLFLRRRR